MSMQIGICHVGGLYTPGTPPIPGVTVMGGANEVMNLWPNDISVFMSPTYATLYARDTWGTPMSLKTLAQETPFADLLMAPLDTYLISAWTFANGTNDPWRYTLTRAMLDAEYLELREFCEHLLATYSTKTFIIQNWEADWSYLGAPDPTARIPTYRAQQYSAFLRERQRAVTDARAAVPSGSTIMHAIEVNRPYDLVGGARVKRVLRDVVPFVRPDMVSYSAYDTITQWCGSQAEMVLDIQLRLARALKLIQHYAPGTPIVLGEVGWPEDELPAGYSLRTLFDTVYDVGDAFGCTALYYWQVWDNEGRGFQIQRPDGSYNEIKGAIQHHYS